MKFKFKKKFGQNFLNNHRIAINIIDSLGLNPDDTLLEIGPGKGMLTQYLVHEVKEIFIVEIDKELIPYLKERFPKDQVRLINEDILFLNLQDLNIQSKNYKVIGSLPYNVSKRIIKKFLETAIKPKLMAFVIQKEVADDYVAKAPKSTFLSNFASIYAKVQIIDYIPRGNFKPEPKVDGAIITFKLVDRKLKVNKSLLAKFIKRGFQNPRKKLINNLASWNYYDKNKLRKIYSKLDIDEMSRASELPLDKWIGLYKAFERFISDSKKK